MDKQTLSARINAFPRWHYEFDLGGVKTPIFDPGKMERHWKRKRHIVTPLLEAAGGSLEGKRVLDLGCNAGFWSLAAIEAGAEFVLGLDARQMHIDQAELVFEAKEVDTGRFTFQKADVLNYDYAAWGRFDVVLLLGLFYHLANPLDLLHIIQRVNTDILMIDTAVAQIEGEYFKLVIEDIEDPRNAVGHGMVLWPSVDAIVSTVGCFGYSSVVLKPDFEFCPMVPDYADGSRRAVICAKHSDLSALSVPGERVNII